ncbi:putative non-specific polyamine oxidase [Dioscorea sansibarensis]
MVIKKPRVVIVGAGISGLTAAHRLHTTNPDLFDLTILEAGERIGGRIHTSKFAGDRIEMGATWIHGIHGCPIYEIAKKINALDDPRSTVNDLNNDNPTIVVAESGSVVDASISKPISALFTSLMKTVDSGGLPASAGPGVGSYLRRGLDTFLANSHSPDSSLSGEWTVEAMQEAVFALKENVLRVNSSADDLDDLGLNDEYQDFSGEHIVINKGYSRITEHLAAGLPPGTIQVGRKVRLIEWCSNGGDTLLAKAPVRVVLEDESVESADHVILTVSLGVLKEGLKEEAKAGVSLRFDPGLPSFKEDTIRRLGFGVVDKLFAELDHEGEFPFMELVFHPRGHVGKIPWWMRRSPSIWPINGGSRVVYTWFVGKEAEEVEKLTEDDVISGLRATLKGFGVHNSSVRGVTWTKWGSDPLFMGSYSFVAVGSSGDDMDLMAEPLPRGGPQESLAPPLQLLFAGEATHRTNYSTTRGAYFSGIREADRLIQHYLSL